jgi:hypothetical protein
MSECPSQSQHVVGHDRSSQWAQAANLCFWNCVALVKTSFGKLQHSSGLQGQPYMAWAMLQSSSTASCAASLSCETLLLGTCSA